MILNNVLKSLKLDFFFLLFSPFISVNCYVPFFIIIHTELYKSIPKTCSLFVVQTSSCSSWDMWYSTGGLSDILYLSWSNKSFIPCGPQPTCDWLNIVQSSGLKQKQSVRGLCDWRKQYRVRAADEAHFNEVSLEYVYSHTAWTLQSWGYCLIR